MRTDRRHRSCPERDLKMYSNGYFGFGAGEGGDLVGLRSPGSFGLAFGSVLGCLKLFISSQLKMSSGLGPIKGWHRALGPASTSAATWIDVTSRTVA
jgi:hypothetical protein